MRDLKRYSLEHGSDYVSSLREDSLGSLVKFKDFQSQIAELKQIHETQTHNLDWLNKQNIELTKERDELLKRGGPESVFNERHESHRYRQIHSAVEQMGGWANFSYWILRHSKEYFDTCSNIEEKLTEAVKALEFYAQIPRETEWEGNVTVPGKIARETLQKLGK